MKKYHVFISHSWKYNNHYDGLIEHLENAKANDEEFSYVDYSVPKDSPIHDAEDDEALEVAITEQMKHASVVLVMAGMYANQSDWIQEEIEIAQSGFASPKPIIAVEKWGTQKSSTLVKNAACEVVKWQSKSIANAIKKHG